MDGYLAIILDGDSQKLLLEKFPPLYGKVFAHHVTLAFRPPVDVFEKYKKHIGTSVALKVYGYAKDEKGEAVLVQEVGTDILESRPQHITISTNNVPPAYSKILLEKGYVSIDGPFLLRGICEFVEHKKY